MTIQRLETAEAKPPKIDPATLEDLKKDMMVCINSDHWRRKKRMLALYDKLEHLNDRAH